MMHADSTPLIAYYESIGHVTRLMLRAAQDQDWEMLSDAQSCCAQLISRLQAASGSEVVLPPEEARRKYEILRKVLADDAQIRLLTQPGLRQLESILSGGAAQRACRP